MGVTHTYASFNLLCAEDNTSILEFDDGEEEGFDGEAKGHEHGWIPGQRTDFYGDCSRSFPLQSEECIALLVEKELEHIPREDYAKRLLNGDLDISIRRDAIDWIGKVHAHYKFGPLSAYLSVNYMDRFLSAYELPEGKAWMMQLLTVTCLSLAAKIEETEVPLSLDLQVGEAKYVFEAKTIQRMELLVLGTLKWRMQAVTPFSFIDYFLQKFNDGNSPTNSLVSRTVELILSSVRGTGFLGFRPSEIAAAVAFSALREIQIVGIENALTRCIHVDKERVLRCYEVIQQKTLMEESSQSASLSVSSIPHSPIGVLDAASLSYKRDDIAVGSHASSHQPTPAAKKRKLSRPSIS
ncbi:cyclin-D3-1-like [Phoenix dactylifera]|uniref:Cyclin-D3-1-like n=1 Tax=Phoenix dactylifera TaxID=42345 RepID=A0A8B9APM8_PHODC|nr:cyclin-D3-1-like [Phoenix dactylifera]XP_038985978.1 cyclin-D3-1-like [Phoenix dactylifera]